MILNILKKIYDFIVFFILAFFKAMIPDYSSTKREHIEYLIKGQILYPKTDSLLREEPNSSSDIVTVINKGTKVEYLNETITADDGEKYDKVKIIKNKLYSLEYTGFVLRRQLSDNFISEERNSISINAKLKILKEANDLSNKKYYDKSHCNCSTFCSNVLNRVFDQFPPVNDNNENKIRTKVWTINDYIKNIQSNNSTFEVVEKISSQGRSVNLNKLQIGDIILGISSDMHHGTNHMMLYIGEDYIIHYTNERYLGIKTNQKREGVVKEKLSNLNNYYTELENLANFRNGIINKRFDICIVVFRYKEKKEE